MIPWFCTPWGVLGKLLPAPRRRLGVRERREIDRMARSLSWHVRRVFDILAEPGVKEALARDFADIAPATAVVHSWVDLVGRVVHRVEVRWGPRTGPLKARVARAAILRMVRGLDLHISGVPDALEPVAYDYMIRVSVDAIVALYNANDLWAPTGAGPATPASVPPHLWARLRAAIDRWLEGLAWRHILRSNRLDPDLEAEITAAVDPGMLDVVRRGLAACLRLTAGTTGDGRLVRALVEVVSVAVRDTEVMVGWDGSSKRAYATELVLSMMEEFDWLPEGAWYRGVVEWMVGMAIDVTVERLNLEDPSWTHAPLAKTVAASAGSLIQVPTITQ